VLMALAILLPMLLIFTPTRTSLLPRSIHKRPRAGVLTSKPVS
jgi:hypothetical protein